MLERREGFCLGLNWSIAGVAGHHSWVVENCCDDNTNASAVTATGSEVNDVNVLWKLGNLLVNRVRILGCACRYRKTELLRVPCEGKSQARSAGVKPSRNEAYGIWRSGQVLGYPQVGWFDYGFLLFARRMCCFASLRNLHTFTMPLRWSLLHMLGHGSATWNLGGNTSSFNAGSCGCPQILVRSYGRKGENFLPDGSVSKAIHFDPTATWLQRILYARMDKVLWHVVQLWISAMPPYLFHPLYALPELAWWKIYRNPIDFLEKTIWFPWSQWYPLTFPNLLPMSGPKIWQLRGSNSFNLTTRSRSTKGNGSQDWIMVQDSPFFWCCKDLWFPVESSLKPIHWYPLWWWIKIPQKKSHEVLLDPLKSQWNR